MIFSVVNNISISFISNNPAGSRNRGEPDDAAHRPVPPHNDVLRYASWPERTMCNSVRGRSSNSTYSNAWQATNPSSGVW